jgi:hypothetical protein
MRAEKDRVSLGPSSSHSRRNHPCMPLPLDAAACNRSSTGLTWIVLNVDWKTLQVALHFIHTTTLYTWHLHNPGGLYLCPSCCMTAHHQQHQLLTYLPPVPRCEDSARVGRRAGPWGGGGARQVAKRRPAHPREAEAQIAQEPATTLARGKA